LIGAGIQSIVCASISITVGLIGLLLFGETLKENILMNFENIPTMSSLTLRLVFGLFVASQIPYMFMPFKQACLVFVEEVKDN